MKCLAYYATEDAARLCRNLLMGHGIEARLLVDPMTARCPAHSEFLDEVAIMVADEDWNVARSLVDRQRRRAG